MILRIVISVISAYLIGSFNSAIALTKLIKHEDIRGKGSGNAGFTNVKRVYGMKLAMAVCLLDIAKTVGACVLGGILISEAPVAGRLLAGIASQMGHIFPLYFGFRGGKGFMCGMAAVAAADIRLFLISTAILFAVTLLTKYVSLASILASLSYAVLFTVFYPTQPFVFILSYIMALTVIISHIPNIKRLIGGTERKTYFFKKKEKTAE